MSKPSMPLLRLVVLFTLAASLLASWVVPGGAQTPPGEMSPGEMSPPTTGPFFPPGHRHRHIVVFKDSVDPQVAAIQDVAQYNVDVKVIYTTALKGYAADLSRDQVAQLVVDPDVAYIEQDRILNTSGQVVPTGVQRVSADHNANLDIDGTDDVRVDVDVAVIDTGVAPVADLNVVNRVDCSLGSCLADAGGDDNGHGTHVAGTIGAIDNDIGVVGVAPGARIHSLKVCNAYGECSNSAILAAVDYVTARYNTIEVVNMSLGGAGANAPLDQAISRSVDAGIVYAVAAGNNSLDAAGFSPASSPDVITVSALADSDGQTGAKGPAPACRTQEHDGRLATFSNFGPAVDVAAPGVCILSTWKDGELKLMSGTSMASPHVAGAAAILASGTRDPTNRVGVLAIKQKLIDTGKLDWSDTSGDGFKEPIVDVGVASLFPPNATPPTTTPVKPAPVTVFSDNFETTTGGWVVNPANTDTATGGRWQRADPAGTAFGPIPLQLANTTSGITALVTGAAAGARADVGAGDIDGGVTSIRSGLIALPSSGALTLTARYYLAYLNNATTADYLRISIVSGTTKTQVFRQLGTAGTNRPGAWATATANLTPFAGKTIRILIEAADTTPASLIEAAVDDVRITRQL
jgi:subtilisin family serine protease